MGDIIQFRSTKFPAIPEAPRSDIVEIPGIPYRWGTNLTDPEIVALYHFLLRNRFFTPEPSPGEPDPKKFTDESYSLSHQLKMEKDKVEMPDGRFIHVYQLGRNVMAFAGTHRQWNTFSKRVAEKGLQERSDEERAESLNEQVDQLIYWAEINIKNKKYRAAEALLRKALEFKWAHQPEVVIDIETELFNLYHRIRDVSAGLALLEEIRNNIPEGQHSNESQWVAFGHKFETSRHYRLAEQVYRTTIARFPRASEAYKRLVLALEYAGRYEEAIEVCRAAIVRGIEDYTQTGYAGRQRRIQRKLDKERVKARGPKQ